MPKFKYKDNGVPFEIEAADQDAADAWLMEQHASGSWNQNKASVPMPAAAPPSAPKYQTDAQGIPIDPRVYQLPKAVSAKERLKNKPFSEQVQGGIGHGINQAALGIKGLFANMSPDDQRRLNQGQEFVENTGAGSTLGQVGGQLMALGGPTAAAANAGGRILTKAVPKAAELAMKGRGALNVGTVGNAAAQGAIQGGVLAPEEGEHRGQNALEGFGLGAVAPGVAKTVLAPVKAAGRAAAVPLEAAVRKVGAKFGLMEPATARSEQGAYKAFERNMGGREGVDTAVRNVRGAGTSMLPKSTAALAGVPGAEAMEAGARKRGNIDWPSHDDNVGYLAWRELEHSPDGLPPSEAMESLLTRFKRNGVPVTTDVVGKTLEPELQEPLVRSAELRRALGEASNGMRPEEIAHVRKIAHELGQFEGAQSATAQVDMGSTKQLVSAAMAIASGAMDSTKLWKLRAAYNALSGGTARNKVIDEAMQDPQKFVALAEKIQAKIDARKELTASERALAQVLVGSGRQAASPKQGE